MNFYIETERLLLRPSVEEDIEKYFALTSDPEVMKYIVYGTQTKKEEAMKLLQRAIDHHKKHGFSFGTVLTKSTGEFIGRGGLIYREWKSQNEIEMGYALKRSCWGKGYATELAKEMVKWGFVHFSFPSIYAFCHLKNTASQKVLLKTGLKYLKDVWYSKKFMASCYQIKRDVSF